MRKLNGIITRLQQENGQTLGNLNLFSGVEEIFSCKTLELAWLWNQKNISCIPTGDYLFEQSATKHFPICFRVKTLSKHSVPGRTGILAHYGNFKRNTKGCILLGRDFTDIDRDGVLDVTTSKITVSELIRITDLIFPVKIINTPHIDEKLNL